MDVKGLEFLKEFTSNSLEIKTSTFNMLSRSVESSQSEYLFTTAVNLSACNSEQLNAVCDIAALYVLYVSNYSDKHSLRIKGPSGEFVVGNTGFMVMSVPRQIIYRTKEYCKTTSSNKYKMAAAYNVCASSAYAVYEGAESSVIAASVEEAKSVITADVNTVSQIKQKQFSAPIEQDNTNKSIFEKVTVGVKADSIYEDNKHIESSSRKEPVTPITPETGTPTKTSGFIETRKVVKSKPKESAENIEWEDETKAAVISIPKLVFYLFRKLFQLLKGIGLGLLGRHTKKK